MADDIRIDDIRIKDMQSTASYMESDDYLPIDGLALGNRKIPFTGLMDSEDDRLPTTDKTPRGAITEHEGDISEIKQSLSGMSSDVTSLLNYALRYKGYINATDANEITESGIYYHTNVITTNKPTDNISFSYMIVIGFGIVITQVFIKPTIGKLFMRERSGAPAVWGNWVTIS